MLKKIVLVLVLLVAGILGYAATRPDELRVNRSATIKAPPEKIYGAIADFKNWRTWSPYETKDPAMKRTFEGAESGKGSIYSWDGNSEVGAGRMEIVEADTPRKLAIKLDFIRPFEGHNIAEFLIAPKGEATEVTWAMHGPCPFVGKVMGLFFDMDKMIGKDFEDGLANLKAQAEKP